MIKLFTMFYPIVAQNVQMLVFILEKTTQLMTAQYKDLDISSISKSAT